MIQTASKLLVPFEKRGNCILFTDNITRLLAALYYGPLRPLSVERLLCVLLVYFFPALKLCAK